MKSLITLWKILADELASRCGTSTTMDVNTVQGRVKSEGLSFLTITLPSFGQDFQFCLDQGMVTPESFLPFRKTGSCLPSFLRGFTESVFDSGTGVLLDNPSIDSIFAVRQLTLIFSKIELPCTPRRERLAFDRFVECDYDVDRWEGLVSDSDLLEFERVFSMLFGEIFLGLDKLIYDRDILPKHGPGATADYLSSNGRYQTKYWTQRLQESFDYEEFLHPSPRFYSEDDGVDIIEPGSEIPSRVVSVPKTQKGPRVIAIEPSSVQYVQQGLLEAITRLTNDSIIGPLISSEFQEPNQLLAQKGSSDGSLATLDLSDASDRVPSKLVHFALRRYPLSQRAIFASRTERASVPGHGIITLSKFASMGSALCFPIEAMIFLTIIVLSCEQEQGHRFVRKDILSLRDRVRVYGDDLIVPTDVVHTVIDNLGLYCAKVGRHKSFWNGSFRESCGKEYYGGLDVSIVKVRRMFPSSLQHAAEVISLVSLRNQFYFRGCWRAARWLDVQIGKVLKYFPNVHPSSSALGRHSFLGYDSERIDEHLHAPLVKAHVVSSVSPKDPLSGPGAMLKFFLKRGTFPRFDERHLERAGRPRVVRIKTRWVSPF